MYKSVLIEEIVGELPQKRKQNMFYNKDSFLLNNKMHGLVLNVGLKKAV